MVYESCLRMTLMKHIAKRSSIEAKAGGAVHGTATGRPDVCICSPAWVAEKDILQTGDVAGLHSSMVQVGRSSPMQHADYFRKSVRSACIDTNAKHGLRVDKVPVPWLLWM